MSAITDLLQQISDKALRDRLEQEVARLSKRKKFGLVFEEHIPECTPLYDVAITVGSTVALKTGPINDFYTIIKVTGETATCIKKNTNRVSTIKLSELVVIAQFGEPIYPTLYPIAYVENAPSGSLWHTLIEADNYHALQLLEYLYAKKVDCIYIDPPYNTGAKDWKYNNNYVDGSDAYRHSKWLSMMEKRLKVAKKLLNPRDSVLIVTIDEKEYLHLGCLLEELFPEARIQMVSVAIHSAGVARSEFSRSDEYYFYVFIGKAMPNALSLGDEWNMDGTKRQSTVRWESMLRSGNNGRRIDRPNLFYPVFFDMKSKCVVGFGEPVPKSIAGKNVLAPKGTVAVLPYSSDGSEACWRISSSKAIELQKIGAFDWGSYNGEKTTLKYLKPGELKKIEDGEYQIIGHKDNGAMIISSETYKPKWIPGTQWHVSSHEAGGIGGSTLLKNIFKAKRFNFPKSVYAVRDSIKFIVSEKKNALILDFFAGSGTTLHAVNLINAEDSGNRRCILVTNNEVSEDEAKLLIKKGLKPGDEDWEKLGIARYVTWPRTVCSIEGHDINNNKLDGTYIGTELPISQGFATNVEYFKLGFLDKNKVAMGKQFKEILPILWLKSGAIGKRPILKGNKIPDMMIFPKNKLAILIRESNFMEFEEELQKHSEIETVFIVTDSERAYREMISGLNVKKAYQLYRDYLDNFRINARR